MRVLMMAKGTPATVALEKAGILFTLHEYDYDRGDRGVGAQAAQALGIEPARLLKTLMVGAGSATLCVLVPTDHTVILKRLAAATGAKDAALLAPAAAERATGTA
jgi:Cys-tRNA(Pro)/Cys-tRNA(Cys) deacylase